MTLRWEDLNWDLTPLEKRVIKKVQKRVLTDYDPAYDKDDIAHEAHLFIAGASATDRALPFDHYVMRVKDRVLRATGLDKRTLHDDADDPTIAGQVKPADTRRRTPPIGAYTNSPAVPAFEGQPYSPATVERALFGLWHDALLGLPNPFAPDPEMPGAKGNPKTANTHFAVLVDIKDAWANAGLKRAAKRRLLLRFGLEWTVEEIAEDEGATPTSVRESLQRGVLRLANHLNGTDIKYEDGGAPVTAEQFYAHVRVEVPVEGASLTARETT